MVPKFEAKGSHYPPSKVAFIANNSTKQLFVYEVESNQSNRYICTYPILGASGHLGPKLREGDGQVPEGIYQLTLEPNTPYHLALRLNYPNDKDIERARADGRSNPGSDILIHGTTGSVGCIAVGDVASEDLFVLVSDTRDQDAQLIVEPVDLNRVKPTISPTDPQWLPDLYREIGLAVSKFPSPQ